MGATQRVSHAAIASNRSRSPTPNTILHLIFSNKIDNRSSQPETGQRFFRIPAGYAQRTQCPAAGPLRVPRSHGFTSCFPSPGPRTCSLDNAGSEEVKKVSVPRGMEAERAFRSSSWRAEYGSVFSVSGRASELKVRVWNYNKSRETPARLKA